MGYCNLRIYSGSQVEVWVQNFEIWNYLYSGTYGGRYAQPEAVVRVKYAELTARNFLKGTTQYSI